MITFSTYPITPEVIVTRAEIERLTAIIRRLNDALEAAVDREDCLRHEISVQRVRAEDAEALAAREKERW